RGRLAAAAARTGAARMTRRIRLWTDLSIVSPTHTTQLLEPLSAARRPHPKRGPRREAVMRGWFREAADHYELVDDVHSSDVAVLPFAWQDTLSHPERRASAEDLASRAAAAGRSTIVFFYEE